MKKLLSKGAKQQKGRRKCPKSHKASASAFDFLVLDLVKGFASAKQQRDAPNAGKSYQSVDDAAEQRGLTTADPSDDVELKEPDAAPVKSTNDG